MKDCNTCRFHQQGKHPADVVLDDYGTMTVTCKDCLEHEGLKLPYWSPRRVIPVIPKGTKPGDVVLLPPGVKPVQVAQESGDAMKKDSGKVGLHLLPVRPLIEIAKVLDFGAKKYAANQWRKGMKWTRLLAALLRHTFAWARGEDKDPETGLSHLAHAGCCVLFLLQYVLDAERGDKAHADNDDRYKEVA